MKKLAVCIMALLVIGLISGAALAQQQPQQKSQEEMQRDLLITNLNALRNQELRAAILQQLMDEEMAQLLRMQAIFSDQYKLDIDKFRAGKYMYDEKAGKFVEREASADITPSAVTQPASPAKPAKQ